MVMADTRLCKRCGNIPTLHHNSKCVNCEIRDKIIKYLDDGMAAISCAMLSPEDFTDKIAQNAFRGLKELKKRIEESARIPF